MKLKMDNQHKKNGCAEPEPSPACDPCLSERHVGGSVLLVSYN